MSDKTNQQVYWKRIGYVEIEMRNGKWVRFGGSNDALDFKFEGVMIGDITPSFTVSILGLGIEKINELTVWNPQESTARRRGIRVFAGYEKDGINNPIFEGYVFEAIPTNPPEMWLNFRCLMNIDKKTPVEEQKRFERKPLSEILKGIADALGKSSRWDAEKVSGSKLANFTLTGMTPQMACEEFADRFNVLVYTDGDVLVAADRDGQTNDPKNAIPVSTETGMLGISALNVSGATITTRLNRKIKLFSWIDLKSTIVPKANGKYFAVNVVHKGHFRGKEWVTIAKLIRGSVK